MELRLIPDKSSIRSMTDERLDFNFNVPLRKAYVVASSYRSGSTYFCSLLWKTGVLGAPSEVLNSTTREMRTLMTRFKVSTPADYLEALLAHRTSKNGVFGMKAHFHHFETFLKEYPALLKVLTPMTYIYIQREDRVAQAVSMAKALQTHHWSSRWEDGSKPQLHYDRELIAKAMKEVELQDAGWLQWFKAKKIKPFKVSYETLTANPEATIGSVVKLLGVTNDKPSKVLVPAAEKQSDDTNEEWIDRFKRETGTAVAPPKASARSRGRRAADDTDAAAPPADPTHFFERRVQLIESLPHRRDSPTGFVGLIRLRRRYDAIIGQNRDLLAGARVLDLMSAQGFWSLAALDAGAAHVVGVEASAKLVKSAEKNFRENAIAPESYQFVNSKISAALHKFNPDQFDVVLCVRGLFEHCHFPEFFGQLARLRPRHVVLDTNVALGQGPLAHFFLGAKAWKQRRRATITAVPNHELIAFMCETAFRWRIIDWNSMGITDWIGLQDYKRDTHRTYVLRRI